VALPSGFTFTSTTHSLHEQEIAIAVGGHPLAN
jgi:hypothetical protein